MRLRPAAIDALVEHRQQVVQDRTVGVEQFVEKGELGLGQHVGRDRGDHALAEFRQIDRAENFVGLGEAREQVFEVAAADGGGELADDQRFRRPRRPIQEQVFAGHDGQGDQIDDLVASDEAGL